MSKDTNSETRKLRWFTRGVEAFRRLGRNLPDLYVCPLCLYGFPVVAIHALTREHVPPATVGGSRLVLTCGRCNRRASGKDGVDTFGGTAEILRKFGEGTLEKPLRGRLAIDSLTLNVDVEKRAQGISIFGLPDHNPVGACDDLQGILDTYVDSGSQDWAFQLSPTILSSDAKQRVSWLRAAYLAGFAALGYRYIFREVLDPVREQIKDPDRRVISFFHFYRKQSLSLDYFLLLVHFPRWGKGLLVQMGRHYVMLPFLDGDDGYYARLETSAAAETRTRLMGKLVPWPRQPEHLLDFAPPDFVNTLVSEMQGA